MQNEFTNGFTGMKSDMTATNALLLRINQQLEKSSNSNPSGSIRAHVVLKDISNAQQLYDMAKKEGGLKQ
ncbi:MAG: hypothetical protein IPJ31_10590 [Bacteroidetes bacterium]|nr:hypothetical protein [Bacteroidota bacterium]